MQDHAKLLASLQELSYLRDLQGVMAVVRRWARQLTGADGVTFVLRDHDKCFYADEDAIGPLWKGRRFPIETCVSGWAMRHREVLAIEDIYADPRVPIDAYRPTFVKSLLMVPIRTEDPIGAIGSYWAHHHRATDREIALVQALANETAIAVANAELFERERAAVRVRDDFLSVAAHELRTPLTSLSLQIESAAREIQRRAIEGSLGGKVLAAMKSSQRLGALVDQLLDVTRVSNERGELALELEELDLRELVDEIVERFRGAKMTNGSTITVEERAPVRGHWDRVRLDEVVTNLVSNACKYGRGNPIDLVVDREGTSAILSVRDHGIGIHEKDHERVFERFERAVSTENYGGLGLGLFITRRIVHSHGGQIRLQSKPNEGTMFTVALPLDAPAVAASAE